MADLIHGWKNEAAFQASIVKAARGQRWMVYHTYDSRRSQAGFPDLVLVRFPWTVFAELKMPRGRLTDDQARWLLALGRNNAGEVVVWRPEHWDDILEFLTSGRRWKKPPMADRDMRAIMAVRA